jgi:uncharacterized membrane protein YphA (DoxX/SURF4 family)
MGVGMVVIFFGMGKLAGGEAVGLVKTQMTFIPAASAGTFITVLGAVEVIFGIFLIIGIFIRYVGALVALMMAGTIILFINAPQPGTGFIIKDFAILGAGISLALTGSDAYSVDGKRKKG